MTDTTSYFAKIDFCLQQNLLPGEDWCLWSIKVALITGLTLPWDSETCKENLNYVDRIYDREMKIANKESESEL